MDSIALVDYHDNALKYLIHVTHTPGSHLGFSGWPLSAKVRVFHASFATYGILREWLPMKAIILFLLYQSMIFSTQLNS